MTGPATPEQPISRIAIPALLDGAYRSVLICTYGAMLEFYEEVLRRQLTACRNQIVLADATRLAASVAAAAPGGQLRHLNRTYVAAPISHGHAAHAKLIMLTGPDAGMLLVGSGNLNYSGYAGAGECFAAYSWSPENQTHLREFQTAKRFVDGMLERGLLEDFARSRIARMWETTEWIHRGAQPGTSRVRHNLDESLGQQFIDAIGGEGVEELIVASPFFDVQASALRRLRDELKPAHTTVLVQPKRTKVDAGQLATALQGGGTSLVHPVSGPDDPYLHAKLIIARTSTRAVSLTGSANCSTVALFAADSAANLEVANLLTGPRDAFDHLLADIDIGPAANPHDLELGFDKDEGAEVPADWQLSEVTWRPPILQGLIRPSVPPNAAVTLLLGDVALEGVTVQIVDQADGQRFEARITGDAAELLDKVVGLVLAVHSPGEKVLHSAPAVAYQATVLEAMDARHFSAERLRDAAALELDDPELATLLGELEQLLITGGRSVWRMARTDPPPADDEDGSSRFPWEAIDWTLVHQHPRYIGYQNLLGIHAAGPGELASYLDALSAALRELVDPDRAAQSDPVPVRELGDLDDDEPSDGGESLQNADDFDDRENELERRRQWAKARNLRLLRNFVRRNLRAIDSPQFREGVGSAVVVPNSVVLDHICWRAITRHEDTKGELVDERLRLWTLMWGVGDADPGYLDSLDADEQWAVLELLSAHNVEALMLASMYDIYAMVDYDTDPFRRLRRLQRRLLVHPMWQPSSTTLASAAALINARTAVAETIEAHSVAEMVYDTVARTDPQEVRRTIAEVVGIPSMDVEFENVLVSVDGTHSSTKVVQATLHNVDRLVGETAERVLASWSVLERLPRYRLKAGKTVAWYLAATQSGSWCDLETDEEVELADSEDVRPPWLSAAQWLLTAADGTTVEQAS